MKNRKWLTYTLGVLFTLITLAIVGVAGFRVGMMQNVSIARTGQSFDHNFGNNDNSFHSNSQGGQGNSRGHDFNNRGFDGGRGGMSIFGGLFSLIRFAVLALLLWFGYQLVQKSGWRIVRAEATAPVASETIHTEVEEKKEKE